MRTPETGETITALPSRQVDRFTWERALDDADLPYKTIAVALAFATFANGDGTNLRAKVERIARRAHMPPSTVRKHLTVLRECGYARRVAYGSSGGTGNSADVHELTLPVLVPEQPAPPAVKQLGDDEPEPEQRPRVSARHHCSPAARRPPTGLTTAHERAQAGPDVCSPVSGPPLASERTTAHPLAPTNTYQGSSKVGRPLDVAEPRPGRPDPYRQPPPAPRCPIHSDAPSGEWVPDGCHDCALLGRAHRARHSDDARAEARARRACTECTPFGLLLGVDRTLLDNGRGGGIRCAHPTVPDEVWAGETSDAPPKPPPVEAPVVDEPGGRHRLRADHLPDDLAPDWRPSPHPRDQRTRVTT
jgi:hypothetical protein